MFTFGSCLKQSQTIYIMDRNQVKDFVSDNMPFAHKNGNGKLTAIFTSTAAQYKAIKAVTDAIYTKLNKQPFKATRLTPAGTENE